MKWINVMKAIFPLCYRHNGFDATHALGYMCMSFYKAIVMIPARAYFFHDYIYITPILLLWWLSTLCVMYNLLPLMITYNIYIYIYIYMYYDVLCIYMINMYIYIYIYIYMYRYVYIIRLGMSLILGANIFKVFLKYWT